MTKKEFDDLQARWIEELIEELPHRYRGSGEDDQIITERLTAKVEAELERDPEFAKAFRREQVDIELKRYLTEHRPKGKYDPQAIIPIDDSRRVKEMAYATKDDLFAWALQETDEGNLTYIRLRLDAWKQHQTLSELEAELFQR